MSYTIITTPGFVMGSVNRGEANGVLTILTRDAGTVRAIVQSARALASKHRFHTQLFSHANFDCIRSREGWRLTGVRQIDTLPVVTTQTSRVYIMSRIAQVLKHYIHGEEEHRALYDWVEQIAGLAAHIESRDIEHMQLLEVIAIARILLLLGYIGYTALTDLSLTSLDDLKKCQSMKSELIPLINQAMRVAQLG